MPARSVPLRCHVVGNPATAEMRPVSQWLSREPVERVDDASRADLLVVCLAHPDEFPSRTLGELLAKAPLARLVVARSTWCESIGRNRSVWPAASLVPARLAARRLDTELEVLTGERPPLPLTASRDEVWAHDHRFVAVVGGVDELPAVLVDSPDRQLAESWRDLLSVAGYRLDSPSDESTRILLYDADPGPIRTGDRLERLLDAANAAAAVLVGTMPPPTGSLAIGGIPCHVVPKLAPMSRLLGALDEARLAGSRISE